MCTICVAKKKDLVKENLLGMFENNPDGAGFCYADKGEVFIHKGIFKFNQLWNSISKEVPSNDSYVIVHSRITTHGGTCSQLTHPFPVEDSDNLYKTNCKCKLAVAHNGILHKFAPDKKHPQDSDTTTFIKHIANTFKLKDLPTDKADESIKSSIDSSKLAFLNSKNEIKLYGEWIYIDGQWFSNRNYERYISKYDDWFETPSKFNNEQETEQEKEYSNLMYLTDCIDSSYKVLDSEGKSIDLYYKDVYVDEYGNLYDEFINKRNDWSVVEK